MKLFFNGQIIKESRAKIPCTDRGLLLGDGLFETIRLHQGSPCFLNLHWQRLVNSAQIIALDLPLSFAALNLAIAQLVAANDWQNLDGGIRLTITRGSGARGLLPVEIHDPQIIIQLFPIPDYQNPKLRLHISSIRRNETSPLSMIKSLSNLDNVLAQQEAHQQYADFALLLNSQGMVASANMANVFLIKDHQIITPPLTDGVLPGITRQRIINTCLAEKIAISEQSFSLDCITAQDSIWLTNALRGIMPIDKLTDMELHDSQELRLRISRLIAAKG